MIASEYSDKRWDIGDGKREQLKRDLSSTFDSDSVGSSFSFMLEYQFERELPAVNKTTKGNQTKELDISYYYDCLSAVDIIKQSEFFTNCTTQPAGFDTNSKNTIRFYEAFYPIVVLGGNTKANELVFKGRGKSDTESLA